MSSANQKFAIGAALLFGLMALAVISQSGGTISVSTTGVSATVNPPR